MKEKIAAKHPEWKKPLNIDKEKYNALYSAITDCLKLNKQLTHTQLFNCVKGKLKKFKGSIDWHGQIVKRDLEAKGIIERIPDTKPQLYRLK